MYYRKRGKEKLGKWLVGEIEIHMKEDFAIGATKIYIGHIIIIFVMIVGKLLKA